MALFEGGDRNADIITGSEKEGCILAILTFSDLETLQQMDEYRDLASKLKNLFAVASISKLRSMISKPGGASSSSAAADNEHTKKRESLFESHGVPEKAKPAAA